MSIENRREVQLTFTRQVDLLAAEAEAPASAAATASQTMSKAKIPSIVRRLDKVLLTLERDLLLTLERDLLLTLNRASV